MAIAYCLGVKIPCTDNMKRFNRLVERADDLLNGNADQLSLAQLIQVLLDRSFWSAEYGRLALEISDAAVAVGYFEPSTK